MFLFIYMDINRAYNYLKSFERDQDLIQEVLIKLSNTEYDESRSSFKTFVSMVHKSVKASEYRKYHLHIENSFPLSNFDTANKDGEAINTVINKMPSVDCNIELGMDISNEREDVLNRLKMIPEKYSRVLSSLYLDELTYKEISNKYDINIQQVKTHIRRGLEEMRKSYDGTQKKYKLINVITGEESAHYRLKDISVILNCSATTVKNRLDTSLFKKKWKIISF